MPIAFTAPTLNNTSQIGGVQKGVHTAGLANGGYVVAWESLVGSGFARTIQFQRYDAQGNQVGAATEVVAVGSVDADLLDIHVNTDGTFTILTLFALGNSAADQRLAVQSFFEGTGGPTAAPTVLNLAALGPNGIGGAELTQETQVANSVMVTAGVVDGLSNTDLIQAVVSTGGAVITAPVVLRQDVPGSAVLLEAVQAPNASEFVLNSLPSLAQIRLPRCSQIRRTSSRLHPGRWSLHRIAPVAIRTSH